MFTQTQRMIARVLFILLAFTAHLSVARAQSYSDSTSRGAALIKSQAVDPEIVKIADLFGPLSNTEFISWLKSVQPGPHYATYREEAAVAAAVMNPKLNAIFDGAKRFRINERVQPMLKLFRRDGVIEFLVYENSVPAIETYYRNTIFISTGLLDAVENDDQLCGLVGHELAHEISDEAYENSLDRRDVQALRRYEGQCDAIAALALRALGMDPRQLGKILFKIVAASPDNVAANDGTRLHPSLASRLKLNEAMATSFSSWQQVAARNRLAGSENRAKSLAHSMVK